MLPVLGPGRELPTPAAQGLPAPPVPAAPGQSPQAAAGDWPRLPLGTGEPWDTPGDVSVPPALVVNLAPNQHSDTHV